MSTMAPPRGSAGIQRWAALGGVAYVVLFVVGMVRRTPAPDTSSAPAKVIASTPTPGTATGSLRLAHRRPRRVPVPLVPERPAAGGSAARSRRRFPDGPATIGGVVYATLTLAALAVETGIRTMSDDTYHHTVYPGLIHAADDVSWVLHASGGAGLAAMIVAASLAALRVRAVPTWAGWLGIVVGILSLGLIAFFPWFLAAIWILVVSIGMFVRAGRGPATAV